jgi:oxalate---CoA ligase
MSEAETIRQFGGLIPKECMETHTRQQRSTSLVERVAFIKPDGSRPPFFCVGAGDFFFPLAKRFHREQPFLGLTLQDPVSLPVDFSLADIAAYHVETILAVQPKGPYYVAGWSANGFVAHQVAQQLRSQGKEVALLVLFDSVLFNPTDAGKHLPQQRRFAVRERLSVTGRKVRHHLTKLRHHTMQQRWVYLKQFSEHMYLKFCRRYWVLGHTIQRHFDWRIPISTRNPEGAVFAASHEYWPELYSGRVVLVRAAVQSLGHTDYRLGWGNHLGRDLEVCEMPGDHGDMFEEPLVEQLARRLEQYLSGTDSQKIA